MRALQLHYTSCRQGQSGNSGFQTRTLTPGIRPDEQREIERHGIYRPPRNARPEPGAEEIARDFPRALRCYRLESGRWALTRSCYTGRDYSGRWGNFFAHTLVLEDGVTPLLWPIDFYEWSGWRDGLDPAEDTDQLPPPLPAAGLEAMTPAESFRLEELREFLREQPGRDALLASMGRALLLGRETSRAVVIRDTATNTLYWMACLQKLFPPLHAWSLTSSSYQDDPRGCADVNATVGETGFTFDDAERRYRFYEFDLPAGLHSEVPEAGDDYPAVVSRWLAGEPDRLARFFELMRLFDHQRPDPDLISAVHLFELAECADMPTGGERLAGMIAFVSRYANARGRSELLELLGSAAIHSEGLTRPEDGEALVRFLAEGARETGAPRHRELACRSWLSLVHRHVVDRGQGLRAAEAAWSCLQQQIPGSETADLLLDDSLWREPDLEIGRLTPETLTFLVRVAWSCLESTARTPTWNQPEIETLWAAATASHGPAQLGPALFEAIPHRPEALAAVSRRLAAAWTPVAVGRALGQVLAARSLEEAAITRRMLQSQGDLEILFGEWLDILARARLPLVAFERYRRSVLTSLPALERQCGPRICLSLLEILAEPERIPLALSWLRDRGAERFPAELAARCVALANRAVPLDPGARGGGEVAGQVAEWADRLRIPLHPDRPLLRDVLRAAGNPRTALTELRLDDIRGSVPELSPEEYETFLARFLHAALDRVGSAREHQRVLLAAFSTSGTEAFARGYLDFFQAKRKSPWPEPLQAALRFWLAFDPRREELRPLAPIEKAAREGLVLALSRLKPEKLKEVRGHLEKARLDARATACWRALEEAIEQHRRSPWARLAGLFGRR